MVSIELLKKLVNKKVHADFWDFKEKEMEFEVGVLTDFSLKDIEDHNNFIIIESDKSFKKITLEELRGLWSKE